MTEESLDPEDWTSFRALGHRMLDDMFDRVEAIRERPVWQPIPERSRLALQTTLPREAQSPEQAYRDFLEHVAPYPLGNDHPRFWGWVMGNGTPLGVLSDMLASAMNSNTGGAEHAANYVEAQVIDWCKEMLGFPAGASGPLVSGGSMANLVGLAVARSATAGFEVRDEGMQAAPQAIALYGSTEMHSSLQRAVEILGMGNRSLRHIPVGDDYAMDLRALRETIAQDVASGIKPICVIGTAATTNTGATDPLAELAEIAQQHAMWFHVDGAFGALAALSPELRPIVDGMERADSLAFDLHKWGYQPFEVACTLVREPKAHKDTFALTPDYLRHATRGTAGGDLWFTEYGIQLTRGFRALKVWMALKVHGADKLGRLAYQNVDQARYLAWLVTESPHLELLAPVPLNVVCFRFKHAGVDDDRLNALNEELLIQLQEQGIAVPSGTTLHGKYALRCAITNHRSRREDFEILVRECVRLGEALTAGEPAGHQA
ncbi:MAG TPA: amino acid decarboxylase [Chloroflexi bacterium]|nr:amino acid decarboxylase [Chloroflexota bacterium]